MDLDKKVEKLSEEITNMKDEFTKAQAELREMLKAMSSMVQGGEPAVEPDAVEKASGPAEEPQADVASLQDSGEMPGEAQPASGLNISQSELELMVKEARAAAQRRKARGSGTGDALMSVDRLAQELGRVRSAEEGPQMTMQLGDLAKMLKGAGVARRQRRAPRPVARPATTRPVRTVAPSRAVQREVEPTHVRPNVATARKDAMTALDVLAQKLLPAASAGQTTEGEFPKARESVRRPHAVRKRRPEPARRPNVSRCPSPTLAKVEHATSPQAPIGKLDANLMANLVRWVGTTKRRLGSRHMEELLGVYRLSGHLPPAVDKAISMVARLGLEGGVHSRDEFAHDTFNDALLGLHGVVYGAGHAPAAPRVEFDPAEAKLSHESPAAGHETERGADLPDPVSEDVPKDERLKPEVVPAVAEAAVLQDEPVQHDLAAAIVDHKAALSKLRSEIAARLADFAGAEPAPARHGPSATELPEYVVKPAESVPANMDWSSEEVRAYRPDAVGVGQSLLTNRADAISAAHASDLSEPEWRAIEPLIPAVKPGGRPSKYERREIVNGILYQLRTGCSWRSLPEDLPPWKIVHHYYRVWREDGSWEPILTALVGTHDPRVVASA